MRGLIDLSPTEAYQLLQRHPDNSILIDIRSSMEFLFVGHPVGAVHIAWIDEPEWDINPEFANEVCSLLKRRFPDLNPKKQIRVILCCRSGNRTQHAAAVLLKAGFEKICHIAAGFEGDRDDHYHRSTVDGWRYCGLPWEQC